MIKRALVSGFLFYCTMGFSQDVVVEFADFNSKAMTKLRSGYQSAQELGKIYEVAIIASNAEVINESKRYLKKLTHNEQVESFNLAQRPGPFERLFSSDEAKLKELLDKAGISLNESTNDLPGKARKTIVIFVMDE